MDRREFVRLSALAAAGCAVSSCALTTPRLQPAERHVQTGERLLISNVRIVDVVGGSLFAETNILVVDGKIAGLFTTEMTAGVRADRTLDLGGGYVTPGLINAHCHMSLPGAMSQSFGMLTAYNRQIERNAEECVKHGVTTVRDMLAVDMP
ncbi:MAG: hypothetical protein WC889_07270, partial [Myxococcota bacterium]